MPKDYVKHSPTTPKRRRLRSAGEPSKTRRKPSNGRAGRDRTGQDRSGFAWSTFAGGVLFGVLGSLVIFTLLPFGAADSSGPKKAPAVAHKKALEGSSQKSTTRFEFYDLLARDPMAALPSRDSAVTARTDSSALKVEYLLQTGSFQDLDEAQRQRAELLLLGLHPHIAEYRVEGGALWHRVLVGPFSRKVQAQRTTTKLREIGIDPLPLQSPRP